MLELEIPSDIDLSAVLERMQPATVPRTLLDKMPAWERRLAKWDKLCAVSVLAGLQTDPAYQANTIRLCWATRLLLALADGDQPLTRTPLVQLLNTDMKKADITRLEDPIEDFFVAPVATARGNFRMFMGSWQNAAFYTETLLHAFEQLADANVKRKALDHVYALLKLSDALAQRADLDRRVVGDGKPAGQMTLPPESQLKALSRRVYFMWDELDALGLTPEQLSPFALLPDEVSTVIDAEPGRSTLDYRPLLFGDDGVVVASPANLSTAVRVHLIDCASVFGVKPALQYRLAVAQAERVAETRFVDADKWTETLPKGVFTRQGLQEISAGRYLHGIQIVDDFDDWAGHGFATIKPSDPAVCEVIIEAARFAHKHAKDRPGFKEGVTLILLGGWGRGRSFEFTAPKDLAGWQFISMEISDVPALSGCEDGKLTDLWRIHKQLMLARGMGFEIENLSGTLNLFEWWRETDHALVPPNRLEMQPPMGLMIPFDSLLETRKEGEANHDRRAVPYIDGTHQIMLRLDPLSHFDRHEPLYGSWHETQTGRMLGVCLAGQQPVWLELAHDRHDEAIFDCYQTWRAALHWLALTMPDFETKFAAKDPSPVLLRLSIEWADSLNDATLSDDQIDASIVCQTDAAAIKSSIHLTPAWHHGLRRPDNRAEVSLASAMLQCIARINAIEVSRGDLIALVQTAAGSPDVRWRHSIYATRVIDALRVRGLIDDRFMPVSVSAASLTKYASAFIDDTKPGTKIEGKAACFDFLMRMHDESLKWVCHAVAQYDRKALAVMALSRFQAALAEERHWSSTARAVRSIHGRESDHAASFRQRTRINASLRACSMLAEMAATQSPNEGGFPVGDMDFDDLQALALMHFHLCELIPAIQGDRMPAELAVSPTGELLYNHAFGEATLAPSVEQLHVDDRQRADDDYAGQYEKPVRGQTEPDPLFIKAIEAEYRATSGAFADFPFATLELAEQDETDVLVMKRSELMERLKKTNHGRDYELAALIERLILPSRSDWTTLPDNASSRDFDLGRFDRRYSLIGRPLVALNADDDPLLAIAPAVIERAQRHNIAGASEGGLQGTFWTSKEMRRFTGGAGEKAGLQFNEDVATAIGALGLNATASVKPSACLNQKATDVLKALGDIDVLAITRDGKHVWVIEAKDIKLCRTLAETAHRLSEYRGQSLASGKPDNLLRHLNRVAYVRDHAADLAKRNRLPAIPQIHGLVIVDSPQPMAFVQPHESSDAQFVRLNNLSSVPWSKGWRKWKS